MKLKSLQHCTVYCGPVSGPVFVEHCIDCTIVVASRQLRIHDSSKVRFVAYVISGPIIEDCSEMFFSRLYIPVMMENVPNFDVLGHMASCRLILDVHNPDDAKNEYHNVKDFKWHNVLMKSPNWSTLSDQQTREILCAGEGDRSPLHPDAVPIEHRQVATVEPEQSVDDEDDEL